MRQNVEGTCCLVGPKTVRNCRLNLAEEELGSSSVMTKLWLAAVLGILLGIGIAYAPSSPSLPAAQPNLASHPLIAQQNTAELIHSPQPTTEPILISILIGVAVALPFFLVTRRRTIRS